MREVRKLDRMAWVPGMYLIPVSEVRPHMEPIARGAARIANSFIKRMVCHA